MHRKVVEKLNSLKELAGRQVERADRIERAGRAQVRLPPTCTRNIGVPVEEARLPDICGYWTISTIEMMQVEYSPRGPCGLLWRTCLA